MREGRIIRVTNEVIAVIMAAIIKASFMPATKALLVTSIIFLVSAMLSRRSATT